MRYWSILLFAATSAGAQERIGRIEFYGTEDVDLARVQKFLRVKPGQKVDDKTLDTVDASVKKALSREAVGLELVCCDTESKSTLFVGLPGKNVVPLATYSAPLEEVLLPPALRAALGESDGTSQPKIRELSDRNEAEIFDVLRRGGSVTERAMAATALGFSRQSGEQVTALVHACADPSGVVRNAAARSILQLLEDGSAAAKLLEPEILVNMLQSPDWSDRNQASKVLMLLTASREPRLLQLLRSRSLTSLLEMAEWRDDEHARCARVILGRLAGLDEFQVQRLARKPGGQELLQSVAGSMMANGKLSRWGRKQSTPSARP